MKDLETNRGELQIQCRTEGLRTAVLKVLIENGYKWHSAYDDIGFINGWYPFCEWHHLCIIFSRKEIIGRTRVHTIAPLMTAGEFLKRFKQKTGGNDAQV
jgi:hypothetical protein